MEKIILSHFRAVKKSTIFYNALRNLRNFCLLVPRINELSFTQDEKGLWFGPLRLFVINQFETFILYDQLKEGYLISFHEDRSVSTKEYFHRGKQEGHHTGYHRDGIIRSEGNFANGRKIGHWVYFYDNGSKRADVYYSDSELCEEIDYDIHGKMIARRLFYQYEQLFYPEETL